MNAHLKFPPHEHTPPWRLLPRGNDPVQWIGGGEEMTTCIYDGARTILDDALYYVHKRHVEHCPECGQRYEIEDDEEDA